MTAAVGRELHRNHVSLIGNLDRLRSIVDTLYDATAQNGAAPIAEANKVVREQVVARHEPGASRDPTSRAAACARRSIDNVVASSRTSLHDRCS
jgi:hypothetical protein